MDLEILRNISWILSQNPSEAEMYNNGDFNNPIPLSDEVKNTLLFQEDIIILLPTHRFVATFQKLKLNGPITVFDIMTSVYDFYQSVIPTGSLDNTTDDIWNYISTAKKKMQEGASVKWIEIMGDLQFFEGLCENNEDAYKDAAIIESCKIYDLILGS